MEQVPVHTRDRLARKSKHDVKFVKYAPLYHLERLERKRKSTLENYSGLTKRVKDDDVTFIKQVPYHPCKWKKKREKLDQKVNIVNEIASA